MHAGQILGHVPEPFGGCLYPWPLQCGPRVLGAPRDSIRPSGPKYSPPCTSGMVAAYNWGLAPEAADCPMTAFMTRVSCLPTGLLAYFGPANCRLVAA